jgi:hypothetical protein
MTKMHQQDVEEIARQISARYGSFNASNLVNYGQTVVVKPGATTDAGRPIRGLEVAEALSGAFAVQPLAVSYGSVAPFSSEEDPTLFERAMNMELDAADAELSESMSSGDQFGFDSFSPDDPLVVPPVTVRLRTRYQRISSRFGRFAVFALRTGSVIHRQAAARVFNRIKSLWGRMLSRSVPVMGLMSPDTLRRRVYEVAQVSPSATVSPAPSTAPVFPLNAPMVSQAPGMPKPLAFDQAALERSVGVSAGSQLLAQAFGGVPSLSADTRAETVGYLFSRMEHDYFGLVSTPFQIVLADEDEAVLDEEEDLEALESQPEVPEAPEVDPEKKKISEGLPDDDADIEAATEEVGSRPEDPPSPNIVASDEAPATGSTARTVSTVPQAASSPRAADSPHIRARMKLSPRKLPAGDPPRPPCRESFRPGKPVRLSHSPFNRESFSRLPELPGSS